MNQYSNSFKPKSRTLLVEDPNVTLPQHSFQNSSYRTHYPQEAFPQEHLNYQNHHQKHYQHSHNQQLPPRHSRRDPSQGNENRRKTLGGPAAQRKITIGNPSNTITRTFLQKNNRNSNLNATDRMDNVFTDTNLLNKSHHFPPDFTASRYEKPKHYFENGNTNQTIHIPVQHHSNTSNSFRKKTNRYFDNNIEGALFGYSPNSNGSMKTNTMHRNTDVANQYEYLQSRQNKQNFSPNVDFNPDVENIPKFNNVLNQNLSNRVLQNDFNDTNVRKHNSKTLRVFTEPIQKENEVFSDEIPTNENHILSNHSRSFPAFHLMQQKLPSTTLQPSTIFSEVSHQPQTAKILNHQPIQAPTLQKSFLHSSNPHVFNVPITIQPPLEQEHINNENTFDIPNQKPSIPPPRYEDLVEKRSPEVMKTFKPTVEQTNNMEDNFHSRSRSDVQRGRSRLRSDNTETSNKWKNLTINSPLQTDEAVSLVPIGVQNIEGYLPRLTLQDNDTTLQKVRSRSLVRSSTMDRNRTIKNEKRVVNENVSDSMGWYAPSMTRNQAIHYLQNKPVGSFLVRKSSSYSGLYTLVVMVESENNGVKERRVRNFLIEVSPAGAKLRGYENEPEFVNLQALIDFHCQNDINLPCKLLLPTNTSKRNSTVSFEEPPPTLYCGAFPTDGLPDYVALKNSFKICSINKDKSNFSEVDFQITKDGVVLEKNTQRHLFPLKTISHCAIDSQNKSWNSKDIYENIKYILFGFVVQTSNTTRQEVHVLATIPEKAAYLTNMLNKAINF